MTPAQVYPWFASIIWSESNLSIILISSYIGI